MSVSIIAAKSALTPAGLKRRPRAQQLRGPLARPQRNNAPVARPVQPVSPTLGRPVALVSPRPQAAAAGVQLTERGLALVVGLVLALALTSVVVIVGAFFSVSNDPIVPSEQSPQSQVVAAADGLRS